MPREPKVLRDGMASALGGIDSGRAASLLDRTQLAFATNVSLRGGFPGTRPRYSEHTLIFDDEEVESWFKNHPLQFADTYYLPNGSLKIASIGGRVFSIDEEFNVVDITPRLATATDQQFTVPAVDGPASILIDDASNVFPGYPIYIAGALYIVTDRSGNTLTATNKTGTPLAVVPANTAVSFLDPNSPTEPLAWMAQDEDYWIVQDGKGKAIIFDGSVSRRSMFDEVPTGTAMCFNEEIGRFCVAVNGNEIAIGNIATSISGPSGVLKFTDTAYLSEGGRFRMPRKFGKITGLIMIANLDRSNGQGAMLAFAKRGIAAFNLPANRDSWKDLTYPVQINLPIASATGQGGLVQVNGDVYYRAPDGLRSFVYAIREFTGPGNVPLSSEMERVFRHDDRRLLQHASTVLFDNRIIFTVNPLPSDNGIYHQGVGTLDLDLISRMGAKAPPVYEGIWTGIRPTRVLTDDDRCFLFALNPNNDTNELWELHKVAGFDNDDSRVVSSIETGAFDFQSVVMAKKLSDLELWVDQVVGKVDILVQWKPDWYPCWFDWATTQICVAFEDCPTDADECKTMTTFNPGFATRIGFGQPPDSQENLDFKPARIFYQSQIRVVWTGQARIRALLSKAEQIDEPVYQVGGTVIYAPPQLTDERTSGTLRSRIGYVQNETTLLWHLIRAQQNADGILEFFLDETGIP